MNFDAIFFADIMSDATAVLGVITLVILVTLIYFVEKVMK